MAQQYTYEKLDEVVVPITWKTLYEEVYSCFFVAQKLTHEGFFRRILPEALFHVLFDNPERKSDSARKSMIDRVFCACDGANRRFTVFADYLTRTDHGDPLLIHPQTGESYGFAASPLLRALADNWSALVNVSGAGEYGEDMADSLGGILAEIPLEDELRVSERIGQLVENGDYAMALACMSLIASTVFFWRRESGKESELCSRMYRLILPALPDEEFSADLQRAKELLAEQPADMDRAIRLLERAIKNPLETGEAAYLLYQCCVKAEHPGEAQKYLDMSKQCGYGPALQRANQLWAEKIMAEARSIYEDPEKTSPSEIDRCCNNCIAVLQLSPNVDAKIRGEACFYLYKYSLAGKYRLPPGETPYQYLEQSHSVGFAAATPAWREYNRFRLAPAIGRADGAGTAGLCFVNAENKLTELFARSIPGAWGALRPLSIETLASDLGNTERAKYFLFDDDFSQNIRDALDILQALKDAGEAASSAGIELYLRATDEHARPLMDTALSYMSDRIIPVYIIDDAKWPAQQLLSRHPLFYPVRAVSAEAVGETLHLVVLGDSPVTDWIVREAFWMMSFRNENIRTEITILAPNGEEIEARINSVCPGMAADTVQIKGVPLPVVTGVSVDFETAQFSAELERLLTQPHTHFYFIAATNDDVQNLSLAKKVRELQIRFYLNRRDRSFFDDMPPMAFLCRDDHTAWISKGMIIEGEALGNQWYNTWSLIPFGGYAQRYHWDSIDGGDYERLAQCIHLQYAGVDPSTKHTLTKEEYEQQIRPGLYDYYCRLYNRDSSYCAALGMPYRLFQFRDRYGKRVVPLCWSILDGMVYATAGELSALAARLNHLEASTDCEAEYHAMAVWEHNRWIRWMLSRGWLPASAEDAVFAWKCGNPRQQLFVAKLHPCLCSYDELAKLSDTLLEECGMKRDFFSLDRRSMEYTKELLQLEWMVSDRAL